MGDRRQGAYIGARPTFRIWIKNDAKTEGRLKMAPAQDIRDRLEEFVGQHITIYHNGVHPVSGRVHEVFDDFVVLAESRRRLSSGGLTEQLLDRLSPDLISYDFRDALAVVPGNTYDSLAYL